MIAVAIGMHLSQNFFLITSSFDNLGFDVRLDTSIYSFPRRKFDEICVLLSFERLLTVILKACSDENLHSLL